MKKEFWVANKTKRDVALSDLRVTIPAYKIINLLDQRHYNLTLEQLEASAKSGSLFKRNRILAINDVGPAPAPIRQIPVSKYPGIRRNDRPIRTVETPNYEELQFSDEMFANENIDIAEEYKPILPKKK